MFTLEECTIQCPHCGEYVTVLVDCSVPQQDCVEDCQVCCAPIQLAISVDDDGDVSVEARREND